MTKQYHVQKCADVSSLTRSSVREFIYYDKFKPGQSTVDISQLSKLVTQISETLMSTSYTQEPPFIIIIESTFDRFPALDQQLTSLIPKYPALNTLSPTSTYFQGAGGATCKKIRDFGINVVFLGLLQGRSTDNRNVQTLPQQMRTIGSPSQLGFDHRFLIRDSVLSSNFSYFNTKSSCQWKNPSEGTKNLDSSYFKAVNLTSDGSLGKEAMSSLIYCDFHFIINEFNETTLTDLALMGFPLRSACSTLSTDSKTYLLAEKATDSKSLSIMSQLKLD